MARDGGGFIPSLQKKLPYEVVETDLQSKEFDGIILISKIANPELKELQHLNSVVDDASAIDASLHAQGGVFKTELPSQRLIYSPVGPLNPDYHDVRSYKEAAEKGIKRALSAGAKKPLLIIPTDPSFSKCQLATLLGGMTPLYSGIQLREFAPSKFPKATKLGIFSKFASAPGAPIKIAEALESARWVARDVGGGDPERMAPPGIEEYLHKVFANSNIQMRVISDEKELEKQYPLFAAVNRSASDVARHKGRVIWLTYSPKSKPAKRSIVLVGKGVTFDTGGVDVKINSGSMGMSRDKCGAAAVSGFMQLINLLQPPDVEVVAGLSFVRNSIGSNAYLSDEMIVARSGKRVRVVNTDAEGRMAMSDVLCEAKDIAKGLPDPHIFTVATLTGHACLYAGPYSVVMTNGVAREAKVDVSLRDGGRTLGDPFEISTLQREDYAFHTEKGEWSDLMQSFNKPSAQTGRGHQGPGAFLCMASGLSEHGIGSEHPLKYSHLDIGGGAGEYPQDPTGTPILALAESFALI